MKIGNEKNKFNINDKIICKIITSEEMLSNLYGKYGTNNIIACNKLYNIELFKNEEFKVGKLHEDEFTVYKLIYKANKIAVTNQKLYNYYIRNNSITGSKYSVKRLDRLLALQERLEFFKNLNEELYTKTLYFYTISLLDSYARCRKYISKSSYIQKKILKKYRENVKELIDIKALIGIKKLKFCLGYIFPNIISNMLMKKADKSKEGKNE